MRLEPQIWTNVDAWFPEIVASELLSELCDKILKRAVSFLHQWFFCLHELLGRPRHFGIYIIVIIFQTFHFYQLSNEHFSKHDVTYASETSNILFEAGQKIYSLNVFNPKNSLKNQINFRRIQKRTKKLKTKTNNKERFSAVFRLI